MSGSPCPLEKQMRRGSSSVTVSSADTKAASPRQACSAGPGSPSASSSGSTRSSQVTTFDRAPDVKTTTPCPISYAPMP